jgi:hypothetical protein
MRMLMRVTIPTEGGNAAAKSGKLGSTMEKILADLKPEAVYFFADDEGNRTGLHRLRSSGRISDSRCR